MNGGTERITVDHFAHITPEHVSDILDTGSGHSYMAFVFDGELTYYNDGEPITVSAGEAIFLPHTVARRRIAESESVKYYSILFSGGDHADTDWISTVFTHKGIPEIMWCLSMIEKAYAARSCNESGTESADRRLSLLTALLLNSCADASGGTSQSPYIDGIISYIRDNHKNKLHIADIARHVHLNPAYCSTLFRQQTGMTIGDYIKNYRLDLAKHELSSGSTVREASEAAGFTDPYNFSKWFHKCTGMAPSEFRVRAGAVERRKR